MFTYGLYRYRLLELIPIARKTVIEEMEDAVITLDESDRVADINPKAARIPGIDPVEVVVEDDGPGIPEDEIEVFESGEETKLRHSSGVGLWLALLIVRRSGGDIQFENTGQGTWSRSRSNLSELYESSQHPARGGGFSHVSQEWVAS